MFRTLTRNQLAFDLIVASLAFVARIAYGVDGIAGAVAVLGMAAAFGVRRLSPGLALAIAWAGGVIQMLGLVGPDISNAALFPVLFASAAYGSRLVRWVGLGSAILASFIIPIYIIFRAYAPNITYGGLSVVFTSDAGSIVSDAGRVVGNALLIFIGTVALLGLSWTLGLLARTRRRARESREAQHLAEVEIVRVEREVGVEQERNRIARDMHDVVAHSLAVVIAQADGARYARESDPAAVDQALTTISATARDALGDVRILLAQLRHNQAEGPQPVLADLDRLISQLSGSGLTVAHEEHGTPLPLGTGQQLAVYRIVQEALTNALRHGDTAHAATVRFDWTDDTLDFTIDNALVAPVAASSGGHGIDGMRERAVLAGGTFSAGAVGDRFVVAGSVPAQVVT